MTETSYPSTGAERNAWIIARRGSRNPVVANRAYAFFVWQRDYPQISAGLKRGFTFYFHTPGAVIDFADRERQLLVGASPNDRVGDTHWYRPEFDLFLVQEAEKMGVAYFERFTITSCEPSAEGWFVLGEQPGQKIDVSAQFLIDAAGGNSVLAEQLRIPEASPPALPSTCSVYAHFENVARLQDLPFFSGGEFPYPPDDAAVHHVFEGGWIWVLRFNNGITSAGAALRADAANEGFEDTKPEMIWKRLLARFPTIQAQFADASPVTPFYYHGRLSFRRSRIAGRNWAMLPSAAGFVDPLLSTGFALTLLGIDRLAQLLKNGLRNETLSAKLAGYERTTFEEIDAAADLIGALYAKMNLPSEFSLLTLLYFAALSFTEAARRLNRPGLASGFLLTNDASFSETRRSLCAAASAGTTILRADIERAIQAWDLIGFTDWQRGNWYPAQFEDLLRNSHKLHASLPEIHRFLQKMMSTEAVEERS